MKPGTYTALITPFTPAGELDEEGLKTLLRLQETSEVEGVVVLGTTGEIPTLTEREKCIILRIAREETSKTLLVGTGSNCTQKTIENTQNAERMGADAALLIAPYYNRPTQEGLYRHFHAIHEATTLPLLLYNNPERTGKQISIDTCVRLAALPRIIGIKEASPGIEFFTELHHQIQKHSLQFALFTGNDSFTFSTTALGGAGVISSASNLLPNEMARLTRLLLQGELQQAKTLHKQLIPLLTALSLESNPTPIKAAMELRELPAGPCRLPLCPLAPHNQKQLEAIINPVGALS